MQATNGQLKMVYCKVCTNIESMEKPLMLKFDLLIKHLSKRKVNKRMLGHAMSEYYIYLDSIHVKNENICGLIRTTLQNKCNVGIKLRKKQMSNSWSFGCWQGKVDNFYCLSPKKKKPHKQVLMY